MTIVTRIELLQQMRGSWIELQVRQSIGDDIVKPFETFKLIRHS